MIAQIFLSLPLCTVFLYAWIEYRRSPVVAVLSSMVALAGLYFVWVPSQSTRLAEFVGIGRGVDLILYTWVGISLLVILNLHLKLRTQLELITVLAGTIEQWIEKEKTILEVGDSVYLDKDVVHASFNVGDVPTFVDAVTRYLPVQAKTLADGEIDLRGRG